MEGEGGKGSVIINIYFYSIQCIYGKYVVVLQYRTDVHHMIYVTLTSEEDFIVNACVQADKIRDDEGQEVSGHRDGGLILVPHPALMVQPDAQHTHQSQHKTH